jgi:hypothetical protein
MPHATRDPSLRLKNGPLRTTPTNIDNQELKTETFPPQLARLSLRPKTISLKRRAFAAA